MSQRRRPLCSGSMSRLPAVGISERTQMLREAKKEIAALVLLTTAKVSRQKLNSDTDRDMIDDFLREETEAAR